MTSILVRGVNGITAKGRIYYCYYRATGKAIKVDSAYAAGCRVHRRLYGRPAEAQAMPGTLGAALNA